MGAHHREPAFSTPGLSVRRGVARLRIPTEAGAALPPRERYANAIAKSYADTGYVKFAELIEAGYACSACHVTHGLNRVPTDEELDLDRFETVALAMRLARIVGEIGSDAVMGASIQIEKVLAQKLAEKITVRNMVGPLDPITLRQISELMTSDPVAARSYRQLQQHGTELIFDFGLGPSRTMGLAYAPTNTVTVYVRNHRSAAEIVSTVVHESSHIHRAFRGSRATVLDEARARSREFLFQNHRRPNLTERRAIWLEVRDLAEYDHLSER